MRLAKATATCAESLRAPLGATVRARTVLMLSGESVTTRCRREGLTPGPCAGRSRLPVCQAGAPSGFRSPSSSFRRPRTLAPVHCKHRIRHQSGEGMDTCDQEYSEAVSQYRLGLSSTRGLGLEVRAVRGSRRPTNRFDTPATVEAGGRSFPDATGSSPTRQG